MCHSTFYQGIVSHGLLGAFTEYINVVRRAVSVRTAQIDDAVAGRAPCIENVGTSNLNAIQAFSEDFLAVGLKQGNRVNVH